VLTRIHSTIYKEGKVKRVLPTFDIEAVNWTTPIAVGLYDGETYFEFIKKDEQDDIIWRFLEYLRDNYKGIKLYAHYAARYDNKLILSSLCNHNERVSLEVGLVRLKWEPYDIYFEDSYPLLTMPLREATKLFEVTSKGTWDHEAGLSPWEMGTKLKTFRKYLKTDCISLSKALEKLCETLTSTFGIAPSISLSTTAVKSFSKIFFDVDKIDSNERVEEYIRSGIYGGRNEVYKRYGEHLNHFDVRSMFVSCYDTPIPIGKMEWYSGNWEEASLVEASVKVPKDLYIGPLPYRIENLLTFPVGEFKSWWDVVELRNAAKYYRVDVTPRRKLKCNEEPILKDFGELIGRLRGDKLDFYWKMYGLALSGKFGQSRWMDTIKYVTEITNFEGYYPLDPQELYFQSKIYNKHSPYIKPAVSMRIRAEARVRHLNLLNTALKQGDIYYGDTDSVFCKGILPVGEKIGDLVKVSKAERGYFIKQKLYATVVRGSLKQRSAGYSDVKLTERDFKDLLEGKELYEDRIDLSSPKDILKNSSVKVIKKRKVISGKASISRIIEGYNSRPLALPEDSELIYSQIEVPCDTYSEESEAFPSPEEVS